MMERKEILERNKVGKAKDEGMEHIEDKAKSYGAGGMCVLFIIVIIYNITKGITSYDVMFIFWGYFGLEAIYKYRKLKSKEYLITGVCGIIAAVFSLATHILGTW